MELLSVPGDAEPCPEPGYWGELLSGWRAGVPAERPSPRTALPLASDARPSLRAEQPPQEFAGSGPKRFAEEKMG